MWIHPSRGLYKLYTYTQQLCDDGKDSPLYTATCDLCPVCVIRARCDTTSYLITVELPLWCYMLWILYFGHRNTTVYYMYIVFFSSSSTSSIFLSSVVVDDCTCKKKTVETYIIVYSTGLLYTFLFVSYSSSPFHALRTRSGWRDTYIGWSSLFRSFIIFFSVLYSFYLFAICAAAALYGRRGKMVTCPTALSPLMVSSSFLNRGHHYKALSLSRFIFTVFFCLSLCLCRQRGASRAILCPEKWQRNIFRGSPSLTQNTATHQSIYRYGDEGVRIISSVCMGAHDPSKRISFVQQLFYTVRFLVDGYYDMSVSIS